ncbi:hypothetical protein HTZ85_15280 [Escherichia coli]|nr:hypothetical protein [Escherichia coli]
MTKVACRRAMSRLMFTGRALNYKDALAITGKGKIIRNFPMIPGIDFAGTVRTSEDPRFHAGQEVLLTGWGVGENHWGWAGGAGASER